MLSNRLIYYFTEEPLQFTTSKKCTNTIHIFHSYKITATQIPTQQEHTNELLSLRTIISYPAISATASTIPVSTPTTILPEPPLLSQTPLNFHGIPPLTTTNATLTNTAPRH